MVQNTSTTTNFDVPFLNEGFLEFAKVNINFLQTFSGNGGIAVSGGSKVDLGTTTFTAPNNLPSGLQASGAGSELKITFASGQVYQVNHPDAIKAEAGAKVAMTGGETRLLGSATGLAKNSDTVINVNEMIGQDGASIVAAGGLNAINRAELIGLDGASLVGHDGSSRPARVLNGSSSGPGTIVAGPGGTIRGNGTFVGEGFIQSGGQILPGKSPGVMTWTGNLTVENGGLAEIETSGTRPGLSTTS